MTNPRPARDIIDQAINENRVGEIITYAFAIVFVVVGVGTIVAGIVAQEGLVAVAGAIASSLFYPALRAARQTRREKIAIRLLEAPLSKAETATDAADMLRRTFPEVFLADNKDRFEK